MDKYGPFSVEFDVNKIFIFRLIEMQYRQRWQYFIFYFFYFLEIENWVFFTGDVIIYLNITILYFRY